MLLWTLGCMYIFKLMFLVGCFVCLFLNIYPSGISGSYGSYIFKFFEKSPYCLHTNLHSTFTNLLHTNLYSHQQCTRVPSSLYPHHYLLFAFLLMIVILISVRWYFSWLWFALVISFANSLTHSVGCFLILSIVTFAVQKLLSLIRSHLFTFAFVSFALGNESKNIAAIYVKECYAYVFLEEFCSIQSCS